MRVRWSNLVVLAAVPAALTAPSPWLARWHWSLDLLACFPVQTAGWLLLSALLLALARRRRPALACAALALLPLAAVLPHWLATPPAGAADAQPVRVLALNLLRGHEAGAPEALAAIAAHDPDVLFCSEVTPAWLTALTPGLAHLPHRRVRSDPGYFGVALFSRWPLADDAVIPLGHHWAPAVRAVVISPAGPFGVLGIHTPRPGGGRRNAERDLALAAIPAALAPLPPRRLVLGDANATPWNPAFTDLLAAADLVEARRGRWAPTWTTQWPLALRIPIDHILIDASTGVADLTAGPDFGSDHLPLAATLLLARN